MGWKGVPEYGRGLEAKGMKVIEIVGQWGEAAWWCST